MPPSRQKGGKQIGASGPARLANVINHFTGRADLPAFPDGPGAEKATAVLNGAFFSPRFTISRFQSVEDALGVIKSHDSLAAREAPSDMVKFVGAGLSILALAKLAGAKVEDDPRSSGFGKMRVGDTTVELWGGMQPIGRYTAQLITGQSKPVSGEHAGQIIVAKRSDALGHLLSPSSRPLRVRPGTFSRHR
jgi:hypothetical protein